MQNITVFVTFSAKERQKVFNRIITVKAVDNEGLNVESPSYNISLNAEAFNIDICINTGNENFVNFGNVRCNQESNQSFKIINTGL